MGEKFHQYHVTIAAFVIASIAILGFCSRLEAKELSSVFASGYNFRIVGFGGLVTDLREPAREFAPVLSSAVAQAVTQQFPLTSIAPAFTYRYNPALSVFERTSGVPGPLFSERALTLGKGRLNFGIGYSYIDFDDSNGTNLRHIRSPGLIFNTTRSFSIPATVIPPGIQLAPGEELNQAIFFASEIRTRIDVQAHVIVPSLRYGVTENFDISVNIPVVNTFVRVRNETRSLLVADFSQVQFFFAQKDGTPTQSFGFRDPQTGQVVPLSQQRYLKPNFPFKTSLAKSSGSSTGIGDISLRAKYRFWETNDGGAAAGLNLLLPSGDVDDFQGIDETHLSTFLYVSQIFKDRFEPHLNLGLDFNADDVDRSSFLYAVGLNVLLFPKFSAGVDIIGRSEFGKLPFRVPQEGFIPGVDRPNRAPSSCTETDPCTLKPAKPFPFIPLKSQRNEIIDFSFGLRYGIGESGSAFFGGIIPLNNDGLRADFIPSGGLEYTF